MKKREGKGNSMYSTVTVTVKLESDPTFRSAVASAYDGCKGIEATNEDVARWAHRVVHEAAYAIYHAALTDQDLWGEEDPPGSRYDLYPREAEEADLRALEEE